MIILDTNVISEFMGGYPNDNVRDWIGKQKPIRLGTTTITVAEIQKGLNRLPKGKRRTRLEQSFESFIQEGFEGRIYDFDLEAAYIYGDLAAKREMEGYNTDSVDLMIASIVKTHNAAIATRNTKDFEGCGVKIINPWA